MAKRKKSKGPGTRYSTAFKARALKRMNAGERVAALASELGVHVNTLYQWSADERAKGRETAHVATAAASSRPAKKDLSAFERDQRRIEILSLADRGMPQGEIFALYGVTAGTIKRWRDQSGWTEAALGSSRPSRQSAELAPEPPKPVEVALPAEGSALIKALQAENGALLAVVERLTKALELVGSAAVTIATAAPYPRNEREGPGGIAKDSNTPLLRSTTSINRNQG